MDFLIQAIGFVGLVASLISFQCKKHNQILFFRTLNEGVFILQYLLLGAYTGMAMNAIGCVRNYIFTKQVQQGKKTGTSILLFCLLFVGFGIATFDGFKSITIILAKVLSTVAYGNKNTTVVRTVAFLTHISFLFYNLSVLSYAGALIDAVTLVSLIIGIIRFDLIPLCKKRQVNS